MKSYWDSSALVKASGDLLLRRRLAAERGFTRTHALAEVFSALTGRLDRQWSADSALAVLESLARDLEFIELTSMDVLNALGAAKKKGVRGGRVHDYLHAVAAEKAGAVKLLSSDRNDFDGLSARLEIEAV